MASCHLLPKSPDTDKPVLASVEDRYLYESDLDGLFDNKMSKEDSLRIMDGFVNSWIKDQLMVTEAKSKVGGEIDIEALVEQYRSSLLLYNYETILVNEMLDTTITESQAKEYYETNKDQYILSNSIVKAMVAKIPASAKGIDKFFTQWKNEEYASVSQFVKMKADFIDLDTSSYKSIAELMITMPDGLFSENQLQKEGDFQKKEGEHEYFVKILDYHAAQSTAPFEYIKDKINKIILNNRKQNLLNRKKQELYSQIGTRSDVKVYYK